MKKLDYEAPLVEFFDVCVERGFAQSQMDDSNFEQATEDEGAWS